MPDTPALAVVSPGAMGSALGRAWRENGLRVVATVAGRSERTRSLAHGLELLADLDAVVAAADIVFSVCPPEQAAAVAEAVAQAAARTRARPLFVDLNAVAPVTVRAIAARLAGAGLDTVDGSISGGPPTGRGTTRLYLSGPAAERVATLAAPGIRLAAVSGRVGDASAVKMCTASVYKGASGLLIQALRASQALGVADAVVADLQDSGFAASSADIARRVAVTASKTDRYPGEMREIARTQEACGLGATLFDAIAAVFESIHTTALGRRTPEEAAGMQALADVLGQLAAPDGAGQFVLGLPD